MRKIFLIAAAVVLASLVAAFPHAATGSAAEAENSVPNVVLPALDETSRLYWDQKHRLFLAAVSASGPKLPELERTNRLLPVPHVVLDSALSDYVALSRALTAAKGRKSDTDRLTNSMNAQRLALSLLTDKLSSALDAADIAALAEGCYEKHHRTLMHEVRGLYRHVLATASFPETEKYTHVRRRAWAAHTATFRAAHQAFSAYANRHGALVQHAAINPMHPDDFAPFSMVLQAMEETADTVPAPLGSAAREAHDTLETLLKERAAYLQTRAIRTGFFCPDTPRPYRERPASATPETRTAPEQRARALAMVLDAAAPFESFITEYSDLLRKRNHVPKSATMKAHLPALQNAVKHARTVAEPETRMTFDKLLVEAEVLVGFVCQLEKIYAEHEVTEDISATDSNMHRRVRSAASGTSRMLDEVRAALSLTGVFEFTANAQSDLR